jgi:hypothetical protein
MNRKQFVTLIVLGLIIGGLGLYLYNKRKESFTASSFQTDQRVLKDFPLNDVTQVRIRETTNEVNLARGDEGWTVKERHGYPANFSEISEFLRKTWELKPVQDVEAGASQYGRLSLLSPADNQGTNTGTLVEFKDSKGANLKTMILGKKQMRESQGGQFGGGGEFPVGRYILVPGNPAQVWLVSEAFANVEPRPDHWINKDFLKVEKIKSVAVTSPNASNTWTLSRETETGDWTMANLGPTENFDKSKASSMNYLLSSPSFNDVAAPDTKIGDTNQLSTAKIDTFEGFTYAVRVGGETNQENLLMNVSVAGNFAKERTPGKEEKPEDKDKLDKEFKDKLEKLQEKLKSEQKFEKWTYQVSKWTVDTLLKPRTDFFTEKKEEKKEDSDGAKLLDATAPPIKVLPDELKNIIPAEPPKPE